jgi:hypothetical protein
MDRKKTIAQWKAELIVVFESLRKRFYVVIIAVL